MRKVKILVKTEEPINEIWDLIIDVKNWNKLIKFVQKISIKDSVGEGVKFYDITGILWIPTKIEHKILVIQKYKKFQMEASMPLNTGKMLQTILINNYGKYSEVEIEIAFEINALLLDLIFGLILEKRLKIMITQTLLNLREKLNEKNAKKNIFRKSEILT